MFSNDAREYGAIFDLSNSEILQKIAVNFVEEDTAIVGEEAFMNPTASEEMTLGYYVSKEVDLFHLDFGIRHDRTRRKGSVSHDDHDDHEITMITTMMKNQPLLQRTSIVQVLR